MAKLVRRGRKLVRCGGKLVRDTDGAPCVCGEPPVPGLLKAVPCAACCQDYATGLPVDPDAVPGWEARPVFYLHGNCWRVVGLWDQEEPPPWMIVRQVYDFLRYAECGQCFAIGSCPILTPGCDAVGFVPHHYRLRITMAGSGQVLNNSNTLAWNVTTDALYRPSQICRTGCITDEVLRLGPNLGFELESFHQGGIGVPASVTHYGRVVLTYSSGGGVTWNPYSGANNGQTLAKLRWSPSVLASNDLSTIWAGLSDDDWRADFTLNASWMDRLSGFFWLRGTASGVSTGVKLGSDNFAAGPSSVRWSLRPVLYCCDDAPPPPDPKDDPGQGGSGGSQVGDGSQSGGVANLNTTAIEAAMGADPMRRCRGCGQ